MNLLLSLWKRVSDLVRYYYFHYTVLTTIAMMEPIERYIFNTIFSVVVSLLLYTTWAYLPGHLMMMFRFLIHLSGIVPYPEQEADN